MDSNHIYQGHTLELLKQLDSDSIDCIITSPPYYGLRAYPNSETIWNEWGYSCDHEWGVQIITKQRGTEHGSTAQVGNQLNNTQGKEIKQGNFCLKCKSWKGQLGLEPDYKMYLNHMLQITAELRRVLKPSGTLWWNMGDTYNGSNNGSNDYRAMDGLNSKRNKDIYQGQKPAKAEMSEKCLMQLPERLAIRMVDEQDWILRNAIIWHKPNHMPSSVKDRLAGSYEFVHLFVKNKKYHFDLDAIRVKQAYPADVIRRMQQDAEAGVRPFEKGNPISRHSMTKQDEVHERIGAYNDPLHFKALNPLGKNPGDILEDFWTITTQPHPFAHFAVYPERLVEPMIKAGCPKNGIVLDPFAGSATTCLVAEKLKRKWIGFEINPEYIKIAEERLRPYINQVKL